MTARPQVPQSRTEQWTMWKHHMNLQGLARYLDQ